MSYKNENMKMIELHENGLDIRFRIRENGVVELADFSSQEVKKAVMEPKEDICYPAVEIHRSGTGSLNMHAYKNNINQSSVDFVYENHELKEQDGGKELEIVMVSPEKLKAVYHMRLFDGVPAVQTWTEIINEGSEDQGLTYVSSFMYQGISRGGEKPYYNKPWGRIRCRNAEFKRNGRRWLQSSGIWPEPLLLQWKGHLVYL